jgi:hypothetical protein
VARDVSRLAATALAVLLLGQLVAGALVDLGDRLQPGCVALVLMGAGLGVIWRSRAGQGRRLLPHMHSALLALLVPLRGPLCELGLALLPDALLPSPMARLAVAAVALLPPAMLLGHLLGGLLHGHLPLVLAGVSAGQVLLWAGAAGWLPAWIAGAATAAALLVLAEIDHEQRTRPDAPGGPPHTLLLGGALALLAVVLARVAPGYAAPSEHAGSDALVALLLPAALVAWPASVLARGGRSATVLQGGGALLLAVAIFHALDALALYYEPMAVVETTRRLHVRVARLQPWLSDWGLWLLSFGALGAAALGLALAALPARAAGWMALGAGLALMATQLLAFDPLRAPANWLLIGCALAAAAAPPAWLGRRGWWLAPLAIWPLFVSPVERRPAYDEIRRPGELSVEAFERTPLLDATLYATPSSASGSVEGRQAQRTSYSCERPALALDAEGQFVTPAEGEASCLGLRLGGRAWHAGHAPLGAAGSVGRLTRLLGVKGRALIAGVGAELYVADLHDAGLIESAVVATDAPLGGLPLLMLAAGGSGAWRAATVSEPVLALRAEGERFDTILIAPASAGWPGAATLGSEEQLERMAERLSAQGRCLLWLDTAGLDAGALRARLAAFGQVFGERAAAFVEPRELDPPLVLLVGWRLDEARPASADIAARLAASGDPGRRVPLRSVADLAGLLLRDGAGLRAAADDWRELRGSRPAPSARWSARGWVAVAAVAQLETHPAGVIAGAPQAAHREAEVYAGLAAHARYTYELADLNETLLAVQPDIDWQAFDREAAHYARAAQADAGDPLLHHALAALLEPLALSGDYGRFARVFEAAGARSMRSVRLALLEAWVQRHSLEEEAAQAALQRAREWSEGR